MYSNLLQSVTSSGAIPLTYSPALYAPPGCENPAATLVQQLQQGQQAGIVLGPAGLVGLTAQQEHQLVSAASTNICSSSPKTAYRLSSSAYLQQPAFAAGGSTALVGASGSLQLPLATAAAGFSTVAAVAAATAASGAPLLSLMSLPAAAATTTNPVLFNFQQQQQRQQPLQQVQLITEHQQTLLGYGRGAQQPHHQQQLLLPALPKLQQQQQQLEQQQRQQQPVQQQQAEQQQAEQQQAEQQQQIFLDQQQQQTIYQHQAITAESCRPLPHQQQQPWMQPQQRQQRQAAIILPPQQQLQQQGQQMLQEGQQLLYNHGGRQSHHLRTIMGVPGRPPPPQQQMSQGLVFQPDQPSELLQEQMVAQQQTQLQQQPQLQPLPQQQPRQDAWQSSRHRPQQLQDYLRQAQHAQPQASIAAPQQQQAERCPSTHPSQQTSSGAKVPQELAAPSLVPAAAMAAVACPNAVADADAAAATAASAATSGTHRRSEKSIAAGSPPPQPPLPLPSAAIPFRAMIDWKATFAATVAPYDVLPPGHPAKCMAGLRELRLGALEVLLAEEAEAANTAVEVLRSRMWDGIVAMDMEWKPDTVRGESHPIALLQLSSAGLVVLVRTLTCGLPNSFRTEFIEDSDVQLVVAGWSNNDERKFEESFGLQTFWCEIIDIQKVAKACGHSKTGVKALVHAVLEPSVGMPKSKKVTMSDWTAPSLQPEQLKYAILDAGCTEHVFRCLEGRF